jgi:gamma-glutamylcyclotransferase (GGCT)/AIG2-like uncharacterized protein YtfP
MKNVFVYGSLMFDGVWNRIVQHHYEKHTAVLSGYKRLSVKGERYPGLVKSFDSSVKGVVYFDVTAQDINRLDKFEGEYYRKIPVTVSCETAREVNADVYLFNKSNRRSLNNTQWDPALFQAHHLRQFITKCRGF